MKDNKVLIPIILFLVSQTAAAIWWAGKTDTTVKNVKEDISTVQQNRVDISTIKTEQTHIKDDIQENNELIKGNTELLQEILREMRNN